MFILSVANLFSVGSQSSPAGVNTHHYLRFVADREPSSDTSSDVEEVEDAEDEDGMELVSSSSSLSSIVRVMTLLSQLTHASVDNLLLSPSSNSDIKTTAELASSQNPPGTITHGPLRPPALAALAI